MNLSSSKDPTIRLLARRPMSLHRFALYLSFIGIRVKG